MVRYLCTLSYLGTRYKGFERQKELPTIQGKVEYALSYLSKENVYIHGAGRTDAGVHAKGQTFSFDFEKKLDEKEFLHAVNRLVPSDIKILSLKEVPSSFDARHSCAGKIYSYSLHHGERDPFALMEFQLEYPHFDFEAYKEALLLFKGKHDFKDFTTKPEDKDSFIRDIVDIHFDELKDGHLKVYFRGNGFMTYMVRIMVGAALKVGLGKMSLEEIKSHLDDSKRRIISYKAPAEGLCLEEVIYEQ